MKLANKYFLTVSMVVMCLTSLNLKAQSCQQEAQVIGIVASVVSTDKSCSVKFELNQLRYFQPNFFCTLDEGEMSELVRINTDLKPCPDWLVSGSELSGVVYKSNSGELVLE